MTMNTFEKLKSKKYSYLNMGLLITAFIITSISIITGSYVNDKENIEIGMISPKRYVASRDLVDTVATEKLKDAARNEVGPLYKHDTEIQNKTISDLKDFFVDVDGVIASATEVEGITIYNKEAVLKIPVALNEKQYKIYGQLTEMGKQNFISDIIDVANFTFDQGITEESMSKTLELVNDNLSQTQWNDELKNMGFLILSAAIKPNLVTDEEAIQAAKEQKANDVKDVVIRKNQKLVDEGEVITSEIYQILEELNLINQDYKDSVIPMIGSIVVVLLLFLATFLYFVTQHKKLITQNNEMLILFAIYVLTILILRVTAGITLYSVIPMGIFAMLVSILISTRVALVLNLFVCIIGTFIFNGDMEFLLFFLITGTTSALLIQFTEKRNFILTVAGGIGIANGIAMISVGLFMQNGYTEILAKEGLYAGLTGVLTVILVIGSLPFWEAVFEVDTPVKLLELTNPKNKLMRRLMIEAPGTYHHCLIVANLAETAAYDIDANPTLARVGSYFHDIGKLKYPLYFGENQVGVNPHDNMDPYNSATIIIQHVKYGKELADEFKLPKMVKNMIAEHHGTTFVKYFYFKASKQYPEGSVKKEEFRYPGPVPQSKEAAIIMLADTIEAAVRSTLSDGKDLNQVDVLIKALIKDKLDDGQLEESNLKIKDLDIIRKAFLKVFQGMYHDRIAYPKLEEIDAIKNVGKENEDKTTKSKPQK